jgi:hypothetical protein
VTAPKVKYTWLTQMGDVIKSIENEDFLVVLMDYGDTYQVIAFAPNIYHETGWEIIDSTKGDIYTLEDGLFEYRARVDLYFGQDIDEE